MTDEATLSIAELIRRDLGRMTPNEKRAARRLLADYPVAALETVARFGEAAGVSAPTVLRMIAKLGFGSYGAFQEALRDELAARRETPLTKGRGAESGDRLTHFAEVAAANIRTTEENIARDDFNAVVDLLADRKRPVHVLGGRFTDPIAAYLVAHLRVLRPLTGHIGGDRQGRLDQLLDIGRRDIFVLFDIRRYSDEIAELADLAAKRGATVVLVTDQWLSPVSRVARHVLPAHVVAPSVWDSSAGLLLLVEALLSAVASELGADARRRLTAIEKLRRS